jgi:fucose 4-O-acetylase-like acetyltransferase
MLARLPASNSARRILVPYTLVCLLINIGYAVTQNLNVEMNLIENVSEPHVALVFRAVFTAVPVFANDFLFVGPRSVSCITID